MGYLGDEGVCYCLTRNQKKLLVVIFLKWARSYFNALRVIGLIFKQAVPGMLA
ncbi:MAG: hypothetical protein ACI80S_000505 [Pseudohongiellaceae bacterium]